MKEIKIAAVIPARLSSSRFPRKVVYPINNIPMVEHVRRRAVLSQCFSRVVVATSDSEIHDLVAHNKGDVVMTSPDHISGTSRVSEALIYIDCTHVVLLQGDEPLLLPRHIKLLVNAIYSKPDIQAWNLVSKLGSFDELNQRSIVKAVVDRLGRIMFCFRKSPFYGDILNHDNIVLKLLGIMAFKSNFLASMSSFSQSALEISEAIEQLQILDNGSPLHSLLVHPALPSVNEPSDLDPVLSLLSSDQEQRQLAHDITCI